MFDVKFCMVWPESAGGIKRSVSTKGKVLFRNCQVEWISEILDRNGEIICINNSMSESFSVVGYCCSMIVWTNFLWGKIQSPP